MQGLERYVEELAEQSCTAVSRALRAWQFRFDTYGSLPYDLLL